MTAHARHAPSSADRWVHCPGSVGLAEQFPDLGDGEAAAEGDAAHWVAFQMFTAGIPAIGTLTPNGWAVDEAMIDGGREYYNHVFRTVNQLKGMSVCRFEQREQMPSLGVDESTGEILVFGTPDGTYFDGTVLHVFDYKYGHLEVSPVENWQLACYAAGVLDRLRAEGKANQWIEQELPVVFHIIQPRCYTAGGPIRTWETTTGALRAMWNRLRSAVMDQTHTRVGENCKYCPARRGCATFKRASDGAKAYAGTAMPLGLTGHDLATELMWAEQQLATLQARVAALAEQAEHEITTGHPVPGYEMQRGNGSEKWKVAPENVAGFGDMLGVDFRKPLAVDTPAQCRDKLKKKGVDGALIGPYIERIPGKLKLGVADYSLIQKAFKA